jgi:hypothetical protein
MSARKPFIGEFMMKFRPAAVALAFTLVCSVGAVAEAQTHRSHLGPRVTYNFDYEEVAVGAQFSTPITSFLEFYPSFETFLVDAGSLWALNADLKVRVSGASLNWLYLGGGLNVTRRSIGDFSNTNTGLDLFAGFETTGGRVHPFGEIKLIAGDGSSVQGTFGLNFTLGR